MPQLDAHLIRTVLLLLAITSLQCQEKAPEELMQLPSSKYHYVDIDPAGLLRKEVVYVPIYSDIYHYSGQQRLDLTATLSVRNASRRDTLYLHQIDYHDSQGQLLREYLKKDLMLLPLESVEFVVEHKEDKGGAGANFIVDWGTNAPEMQAVIQAVMISTVGQQGVSFLTEGVVIERHLKSGAQ